MTDHLNKSTSFPHPRPNEAAQTAQVFYEVHGGAGPIFLCWLLDRLFRSLAHEDDAAKKMEQPAPFTPFTAARHSCD